MIEPKLTPAEFQALTALMEAGSQAVNAKLAAAVAEFNKAQEAAKQEAEDGDVHD